LKEKGYDAVNDGVIINTAKNNFPKQFINALKQHRFWIREKAAKIPA
jgi:hypothetical protein